MPFPSTQTPLVAVDANALDRKTPARSASVDRFERLVKSGAVSLFVGTGVRAEIEHASAPGDLRHAVPPETRRAVRPLTAASHIARIRARAIVRGNARPGKHESDAAHLSEAAEAGCLYFITYDGRVLCKRGDLEGFALPGPMRIVTLDEFLDLHEAAPASGHPPVAKPG